MRVFKAQIIISGTAILFNFSHEIYPKSILTPPICLDSDVRPT